MNSEQQSGFSLILEAPPERKPSPFRLHSMSGTLNPVKRELDRLLSEVNARWRKRRIIAISAAAVLFSAGLLAFYYALYLLAPFAFFGGSIALYLGLTQSRYLEVEVETLTLSSQLIDQFDELIDPKGELRVVLDLRSAAHESKRYSQQSSSERVIDHWFSLALPLRDNHGIELTLREHVTEVSRRNIEGRRTSRDYKVALYTSQQWDHDHLSEEIVSKIAAPIGSSLQSRVREGVDSFEVVVNTLRDAHLRPLFEEHAIDTDAEPELNLKSTQMSLQAIKPPKGRDAQRRS